MTVVAAVHQFAHVGGAGGRRQCGADAEQQARQAQGFKARGQQHQQGGEHRQGQGDEDQRATPDPIGQAAKQQQHRNHPQYIPGERHCRGPGAITGKLGVSGVQRCLQVDRKGDQAQGKSQ
ncbi:hypothetical protein D3C80_1187390 [compost metagenome]